MAIEDGKQLELKKDALGLLGATLVGVVIMAPSLAIYANWSPMALDVGNKGALIYLVALVMTLPTAYSYAVLSSRVPNAGSVFSWISRFIHPRAGLVAGYSAIVFYMALAAFIPPLVASTLQDLFDIRSEVFFAVVVFALLVLVVPIAFAGVSINLGTAAILVSIEAIIVLAIIVAAHVRIGTASLSLEPLSPSGLTGASVMTALVLGVLSFTGFDAVSTVAEETHTSAKIIPRATILSAILAGAFWVVTTWLLGNTIPGSELAKVVGDGGNALTHIADRAMGDFGGVLINLMALEASLAITLASIVGASRVAYAMGRDGYLGVGSGRLHERTRTPRNAVALVVVVAALVNLAVGSYVGWNINMYIWIANVVVFFGLVLYIGTNLTHLVYFLRFRRDEFNPILNGLVPIVGAAIAGYYLVTAFFDSLWNAGMEMGRSSVLVCVALAVVFVVVAVVVRLPVRARAESEAGEPGAPVI